METISWKNNEVLTIHAQYWSVEQAKMVITLVHGQGEHIGRYDHLARWYNERGVSVLGFDHQGYGQSGGRRGHIRNMNILLDGIARAIDETRRRHPAIPHFLYGHSMGGHLVLNYALRRSVSGLAGVIATDPWIRLAFPTPLIKLALGRLLYRIVPSLQLPNGLAVGYLSHDPAVVQAYLDDPYVHFQLSIGAGISLLEGANWLNRYAGPAPLPLLLQHGSEDKITSAAATREFAGRVSGDVTYREWPGLYHEIHNEPEKEDVFGYTLDWMARLVAG